MLILHMQGTGGGAGGGQGLEFLYATAKGGGGQTKNAYNAYALGVGMI